MFKMGCSMARKILAPNSSTSTPGHADAAGSSSSKNKSKDKQQQSGNTAAATNQELPPKPANKTSGEALNDFSKLEDDPRIPLNVRQIFKITKSWKAIARTMSKTGTAMFLNLFEQNQDLFYLFDRFQHLKGRELHESMELREHAATVMSTLDQSINSLSDYDNFVTYLHSIGKLHRKVPGFKQSHFWKIEQPFLKAVKQTLDERCNETIEEIYKIAIKLIIETIADGYGLDGDQQALHSSQGAERSPDDGLGGGSNGGAAPSVGGGGRQDGGKPLNGAGSGGGAGGGLSDNGAGVGGKRTHLDGLALANRLEGAAPTGPAAVGGQKVAAQVEKNEHQERGAAVIGSDDLLAREDASRPDLEGTLFVLRELLLQVTRSSGSETREPSKPVEGRRRAGASDNTAQPMRTPIVSGSSSDTNRRKGSVDVDIDNDGDSNNNDDDNTATTEARYNENAGLPETSCVQQARTTKRRRRRRKSCKNDSLISENKLAAARPNKTSGRVSGGDSEEQRAPNETGPQCVQVSVAELASKNKEKEKEKAKKNVNSSLAQPASCAATQVPPNWPDSGEAAELLGRACPRKTHAESCCNQLVNKLDGATNNKSEDAIYSIYLPSIVSIEAESDARCGGSSSSSFSKQTSAIAQAASGKTTTIWPISSSANGIRCNGNASQHKSRLVGTGEASCQSHCQCHLSPRSAAAATADGKLLVPEDTDDASSSQSSLSSKQQCNHCCRSRLNSAQLASHEQTQTSRCCSSIGVADHTLGPKYNGTCPRVPGDNDEHGKAARHGASGSSKEPRKREQWLAESQGDGEEGSEPKARASGHSTAITELIAPSTKRPKTLSIWRKIKQSSATAKVWRTAIERYGKARWAHLNPMARSANHHDSEQQTTRRLITRRNDDEDSQSTNRREPATRMRNNRQTHNLLLTDDPGDLAELIKMLMLTLASRSKSKTNGTTSTTSTTTISTSLEANKTNFTRSLITATDRLPCQN